MSSSNCDATGPCNFHLDAGADGALERCPGRCDQDECVRESVVLIATDHGIDVELCAEDAIRNLPRLLALESASTATERRAQGQLRSVTPTMRLFHDDDCGEFLDADGVCPRHGFSPDMQSLGYREPYEPPTVTPIGNLIDLLEACPGGAGETKP